MDGLYTNRSALSDFACNAFVRYGHACDVMIASAFFSDSNTIIELLERDCRVQLVVRLAAATSADHLKKLIRRPGVQIRYFTDRSFHPKLYVFGASCALVGSANLTASGLKSNQEILIAISSEDPRFDELSKLFGAYWDEAEVLTEGVLARFSDVIARHPSNSDYTVDSAIIDELGQIAFSNVERGLKRPERRQEFLAAYRRRYQSFVEAYSVVSRVYRSIGRRITGGDFPLRIEIDQWFSFIRELYARGDAYHSAPFICGGEQEAKIVKLANEYVDHGWQWLTEKLEPYSYPTINAILGNPSLIAKASEDQLYEALLCVHAFHDRFRFYDGGHPTMRCRFIEDNGLDKIKFTITHLLHGEPKDYIVRMADSIFDPKYQLQHFGEMCVQETYGWVNSEDVPICNGRTLKSLRWLGFNVNAP